MTNISQVELEIIKEEEAYLQHLKDTANNESFVDNREILLQQIFDLRESMADANADDIPQISEQIQRLSQILNQSEYAQTNYADLKNPYFGHMRLKEKGRERDFFIGSQIYSSKDRKILIVDWRNSPISIIYYRYADGEDYEEEIGGRYIEGEVIYKRALMVEDGELKRIQASDFTLVKDDDNNWDKIDLEKIILKGGKGTSVRADSLRNDKAELGLTRGGKYRKDKHLPNIAALIDDAQFDLITRPESGIVAIQGTAGSGKTTIALHRIAWLHAQDKHKFAPHRMMVMVFNKALANYISKILPALGIDGVNVEIFESWTSKTRKRILATNLPHKYSDRTPVSAIRLKKHPVMLTIIENFIKDKEALFEEQLASALAKKSLDFFPTKTLAKMPFITRLYNLAEWIEHKRPLDGKIFKGGAEISVVLMRIIDEFIDREISKENMLVKFWEELFTSFQYLHDQFLELSDGDLNSKNLTEAIEWCRRQYVARMDAADAKKAPKNDEEDIGSRATLDNEDDPILLLMYQRLIGDIRRNKKIPLKFSHMVIDEAQDLSPLELKVLFNTATSPASITLAGDVNQKMIQYNGFHDWDNVFKYLGLDGQKISPLKVSYRSTYEIMDFAMQVLDKEAYTTDFSVTRRGAPVELFQYDNKGAMLQWLSQSLHDLYMREPTASVAVICAKEEAAREYYNLLEKTSVPKLRLIADQDFPFTAGVDVTDISQVKGLEFDYVILLDADTVNYPENSYSRFLLHVGATRAAHQLWLMNYRKPSLVLPQSLLDNKR